MSLSENWAQDRRGPLALEEKAEGLPQDSLEVVVAELEPITEPLGHRHLVGCLAMAFADLDPERPERQGADLDVCRVGISQLVPRGRQPNLTAVPEALTISILSPTDS
jgi:hypothetical protein